MARTVPRLGPRRPTPGRGGTRLEPRHHPQRHARTRLRHHLRRRLLACADASRAEEHLPRLLDDIRDIVDDQSQTDPTFQHPAAVHPPDRRRGPPPADHQEGLHRRRAAHAADHPHASSTTLGFRLDQGRQVPAPKKIKQTDAIFERLKQVNPEADEARRHAAAVAGRQGDGEDRPVLPRGQEPGRGRRRRTTTSSRRRR